jgi:predicted transposase YdaD
VTQQPDLATQEILTGEFQWVERDTDVLVKVVSPSLGEFIVLTEFQLRPDPRMPRRIAAYASLTEERHNCLVYPVVINILPRSETMTIPTRYETECLGLTAHREYRVINLWELDVKLVFQTPLPPLLPFPSSRAATTKRSFAAP